MGPAAADEGAGVGVAPASAGGAAFVSSGATLACGCGSTVVATVTTVAAACDVSGFWAVVWASPTGVTGGSGERRSAWAAAAVLGLGLASGILAPGSVDCSRLIGAGVAAGSSETDSGARGVDAAMAFASTVMEGFAAIASGTNVG